MSGRKEEQVSQKSPFAGCFILIAALAVMVFLVVFSIYSLFRQFGEIEKFTDSEPGQIETIVEGDFLEERDGLKDKLADFEEDLNQGGVSAEVKLTEEELNLAIAEFLQFEDLRGTLRVDSISPEEMRFEISFRMNGKPRLAREGEEGWMTSDPRYLNGTMVAVPGLLGGEVVLQVSDIEVVGADVPEGFLGQFSPYRITERYAGEGRIGEVMAQLTAVELGDGFVSFVKEAGVLPADTLSDEDVAEAGDRLFTVLGVVAVLFLGMVAILLFIGMRINKRREVDDVG